MSVHGPADPIENLTRSSPKISLQPNRCQGGDFTNDNGTGGRSICGADLSRPDFTLPHPGPGILSMASAGPNTNGSQFFLCTSRLPFLNGKHTVFGQVVEGYNVIKAVEACGCRGGRHQCADVIIGDCGDRRVRQGLRQGRSQDDAGTGAITPRRRRLRALDSPRALESVVSCASRPVPRARCPASDAPISVMSRALVA